MGYSMHTLYIAANRGGLSCSSLTNPFTYGGEGGRATLQKFFLELSVVDITRPPPDEATLRKFFSEHNVVSKTLVLAILYCVLSGIFFGDISLV